MTREKAIQWIRDVWLDAKDYKLNGTDREALEMAIKALEQEQEPMYCDRNICIKNEYSGIGCNECEVTRSQEPCDDCISRSSIKKKLQEHHDFFVKAYGGFSNLPQNDKSRVDEITNCITTVVNEPSATPAGKAGRWIGNDDWYHRCSKCRNVVHFYIRDNRAYKFCPYCGTKMHEAKE